MPGPNGHRASAHVKMAGFARKLPRERGGGGAMLYEWTQLCLPFTDRRSPSGGPFCDMSLFPLSRCTIVEGLHVSLCESRTRTKEGQGGKKAPSLHINHVPSLQAFLPPRDKSFPPPPPPTFFLHPGHNFSTEEAAAASSSGQSRCGGFFQSRQGREGELGEAAAEGDWQKNGG